MTVSAVCHAQITTDGTVSTDITTPDNLNFNIIGGRRAGGNLFHSFKEFSVPTEGTAIFDNASDIQNIISRVTGGSPSNIDGLIKAGGNANLFIINPNGIIFGSNARLQIGGSFLVSTADRIKFADGSSFIASAPLTTSLLTVSAPIGLQYGEVSKTSDRSIAINGNLGSSGLQVQDGKTLALVGEDIFIKGGLLVAPAGRVELGSVSNNSFVSLAPVDTNSIDKGWILGYDGVQNFRDIQLVDGTFVGSYQIPPNAETFNNSGAIQLQSRRLTLAGGSTLAGQNTGVNPAGNITVKASEFVELSGGSSISNDTYRDAKGGDISIEARQLFVREGGRIQTSTQEGTGEGGKLTIVAPESVEVTGGSNSDLLGLLTQTASNGNAGPLQITTGKLILNQGGRISTSTTGAGNGGSLRVNATSVEISGISADGSKDSGLFAQSLKNATGNGGNLEVNAGLLVVRDGGRVSVGSLSSGNAGNLTLQTNELDIRNDAEINVSSDESTGNAGNLEINSGTISLDNRGKLRATSKTGRGGGNITIKDLDSLVLRGNSAISATAGGDGNGGNIEISTKLLTALENSNITANAEGVGNGGKIDITTKGFFISPDSKVTATSERGVDGVVDINRLENDPETGLLTLPAEPVNISGLIAQGCSSGGSSVARASKFVVTGRGGLPPTPTEAFRGDVALADLGKPLQTEATQAKVVAPTNQNSPKSTPLVEAQGWVLNPQGEVMLTASAPNVTPSIPWMKSNSCHG